MALPHLPAEVVEYHGIEFSIVLGFRNIQNLGNLKTTLFKHIIDHLISIFQFNNMGFNKA